MNISDHIIIMQNMTHLNEFQCRIREFSQSESFEILQCTTTNIITQKMKTNEEKEKPKY